MSKKRVVLLVLGETGAGKSTFINYCSNYFLGGKLNYDFKYTKLRTVIPNPILPNPTDRMVRHSETNIYDKTVSQTSQPNIYTFNKEGIEYLIIDTPGFGDTDRSKDEKNLQNIMSTASGQQFISSIVLIINGSISRETTNLRYVWGNYWSMVVIFIHGLFFPIFTKSSVFYYNSE